MATKAREPKNIIVGLDIGTSKIVAMVAEVKPDDTFEIIGMGTHPSRGLKKGVVVNIETTVSAIQRALEEAELMADCKIMRVNTGIAGSHVKSFNSQGMVAIKDKEVTQPRPCKYPTINKSCMCSIRNSSLTARRMCASRWAWRACGWR
jgi:cell division protein FtsA